ncbi:MAG: hypothetical protein JST94_11890 [Bacteroidetes bacterium]|nr:hypothetical protein [Bacteroidota bacterium]MBS1672127.1 hypothetical protein [Bacteroidota bacterium]
MRVLYNYKPYEKPQKARYFQTGNEYGIDKVTGLLGWSKVEVETIVIGEDDTAYIEELKEFRCCDTTETNYGEVVLLPLGFHKSRLLEWLKLPGQQLEMFE